MPCERGLSITWTNIRNRYFKTIIFHPPGVINFSNFFITPPKTFQLSLGVAGKEILTLSALSRSCQFLPLSDRTIRKAFACTFSTMKPLHGKLNISGEASPTFGHANANFSVFIDRIRNQFLKKWIMIMIYICICMTKCRAGFATA